MIGLSKQNYLYSLLQRKNPSSDLLNENFWTKADKLEEPLYKKVLALLFNNKSEEAEKILKDL